MKQVIQRLRDGTVDVIEVPEPVVTDETVLVDVRASLLSAGTERAKVQAGKKSLIGKARARPDQVAQVIEKARSDGLAETVRAVRARLDQPSALGYSAAGVVMAVGARVRGVGVGDRVAIGGGDYAVHAEVDRVPGNLCVPMPAGIEFEQGSFACVGSIALHGVRQAEATVGERVAVIGQGLVGQLTGMILRAAGCSVVGIDLDDAMLRRAREVGAADVCFARSTFDEAIPQAAGDCDAVIVTAATRSDDPVELAPRLCRDRGRVVIVGDVGLHIPRGPYYDKEIDVRLSRSYGPGRYDSEYEEHGHDYPIGYVRWTEGRNMRAIVELIAVGRLPVSNLITARIPIDEAAGAYQRLAAEGTSPLGVVIEYSEAEAKDEEPPQRKATPAGPVDRASVIGTGSFAQRILIPGLQSAGFTIDTVASATGLSAQAAVERIGAASVGTPGDALASNVGLIAIATRHGSHAELAEKALIAGRAVFVEKPPCLTWDELQRLRKARSESGAILAVGFNRRHAPLSRDLRDHFAATDGPRQILIRVNAARLPDDHWVNDLDDGGGRLLGEGCHFVDLACWLTDAVPSRVTCSCVPENGIPIAATQSFHIELQFADGSLATILYSADGAASLPKEYVEVHSGGRSAILDDFRRLTLWTGRRSKRTRRRGQDKGHEMQFQAVAESVSSKRPQDALDPLDTMCATLAAFDAAQLGIARPLAPPAS